MEQVITHENLKVASSSSQEYLRLYITMLVICCHLERKNC